MPEPFTHDFNRPTLIPCATSPAREPEQSTLSPDQTSPQQSAAPELRPREDGGFEQRAGGDLHGVGDPFGIGERYGAGSRSWHDSSIGEDKAKTYKTKVILAVLACAKLPFGSEPPFDWNGYLPPSACFGRYPGSDPSHSYHIIRYTEIHANRDLDPTTHVIDALACIVQPGGIVGIVLHPTAKILRVHRQRLILIPDLDESGAIDIPIHNGNYRFAWKSDDTHVLVVG